MASRLQSSAILGSVVLYVLLHARAADVDNNIHPLGSPQGGRPPPDLGAQRPHGQFPPDIGPAYVVDLSPQRPHGQFPPADPAVVVHPLRDDDGARHDPPPHLGPHRPAGLTDPNGPPGSNGPTGDLGPQRPSGQFAPESEGLHRQMDGQDSDLGPRRPSGQTPPADDRVQHDGVKRPPMDVGPHRPAGQTDPNGPPGSNGPVDLGPQRPSGQFPPGASRPVQFDTDVGPHRPSGQHVPAASLADDGDASGYSVYWNVPSFMCHRYGFPFSNLSGQYGIVQNDDDVFRGTKIAILYDPGLYPALVDNDGTVIARNGGVPQEGDLELHLQRLQQSIEDQVPADFNGLGVIDFEAWRPVWAQNFGTLRAYQAYSVQVERLRAPLASNATLTARAKKRFESAAKEFFLRSLELAQRLRPNSRWGYYAFPYCFNGKDDNFDCSDNLRNQNAQIQWLFDASTALFPSVYLSKTGRSADDEFLFVYGKLREAVRVAKGRNIVYPYLWYRYRDAGFLSDDDLRSCLALPRALGLAGAVVWGSSGDMNNQAKCKTLDAQLGDRLGPAIRKFAVTLSDESVRKYVQQRNASATSSRVNDQVQVQVQPSQPNLATLEYTTL